METQKPSKFLEFCQMVGLHPFVGFGMFAVDVMLFAAETGTAGGSWLISIPVAMALSVPCILIQKYTFGDTWGAATGKGLMVGVLTAIPTALPGMFTLIGGGLGTIKMFARPK